MKTTKDHRGTALNRICRQCGKAYTPACDECHKPFRTLYPEKQHGLEDNG